jgi:hypothetical protein
MSLFMDADIFSRRSAGEARKKREEEAKELGKLNAKVGGVYVCRVQGFQGFRSVSQPKNSARKNTEATMHNPKPLTLESQKLNHEPPPLSVHKYYTYMSP